MDQEIYVLWFVKEEEHAGHEIKCQIQLCWICGSVPGRANEAAFMIGATFNFAQKK